MKRPPRKRPRALGGGGAHTNSLFHTHKGTPSLLYLPLHHSLVFFQPLTHVFLLDYCRPQPSTPTPHPHFFFPHPSSFPLLRKLLLSSPLPPVLMLPLPLPIFLTSAFIMRIGSMLCKNTSASFLIVLFQQ